MLIIRPTWSGSTSHIRDACDTSDIPSPRSSYSKYRNNSTLRNKINDQILTFFDQNLTFFDQKTMFFDPKSGQIIVF